METFELGRGDRPLASVSAELYSDLLKSRQSLAEAIDIGRDKLIRAVGADPRIEVHDFVERIALVEVQVVDVASQASPERDGQLGLEEADHGVRVDGGDRQEVPIHETSKETLAVRRHLSDV